MATTLLCRFCLSEVDARHTIVDCSLFKVSWKVFLVAVEKDNGLPAYVCRSCRDIRPSLTLPRTYNKAWLNAAFFPELTTRSCDGSSDTVMQQGDVYSSFQVSWKNLGSCTCANRSSLRFLTTWEQGYGETN